MITSNVKQTAAEQPKVTPVQTNVVEGERMRQDILPAGRCLRRHVTVVWGQFPLETFSHKLHITRKSGGGLGVECKNSPGVDDSHIAWEGALKWVVMQMKVSVNCPLKFSIKLWVLD